MSMCYAYLIEMSLCYAYLIEMSLSYAYLIEMSLCYAHLIEMSLCYAYLNLRSTEIYLSGTYPICGGLVIELIFHNFSRK